MRLIRNKIAYISMLVLVAIIFPIEILKTTFCLENKIIISKNIQENIVTQENIDENTIEKSKINIEALKTEEWKIEIPSIQLEANINEGTTQEVMAKYVGHFTNTDIWDGNIGLAAHNRRL